MRQFSSLFSQVVGLVSRYDFNCCVAETNAERHARGFDSWTQFVSMLFCQLARAHSLREICDGLSSCEGKLTHLGLTGAPSRATLAYANRHRPSAMYERLFGRLYNRFSSELASSGQTKRRFKFKHKIYSIDSTTIDLCLKMYDWAKFTRAKGAVKLHLKLDHDGHLPCFASFTDGKSADITVARTWKFERDSILVFDRGYLDYAWYGQLSQDGVYFVTRLRDNADYELVDDTRELMKWNIVCDEVITIEKVRNTHGLVPLRRVQVQDPDSGKYFTFLTNHHGLEAATVADIYKQRWQIELFFKALKSNLKIKSFLGTSANAVWTQIWTALIAILILKYMMLRARWGWSFSSILAMLRFNLFTHRDLWTWLQSPRDILAAPPGDPNTPLDLEMPEKPPRGSNRFVPNPILDSMSKQRA